MDQKTFEKISGSSADMAQYLTTLEDRLKALETAASAQVSIAEPRSVTEVLKAELASIKQDPAPHIARKVAYGLTQEKAEAAVNGRKQHLTRELGLAAPGRAAKKAAAALILLAFMLGISARAADTQGYPYALIGAPNLPAWPAQTLTNGQAVPYNQPNLNGGVSNYIPLRVTSGLGVSSVFAIPYGGGSIWTNTSAYQTNATGTEVIYFYPSVDGTNAFGPLPWATISAAANNTNPVVFGTNWSYLALKGFVGLFYTVSNNCSLPIITGGGITNITAGQTNIYQAGVTFNRPNQ